MRIAALCSIIVLLSMLITACSSNETEDGPHVSTEWADFIKLNDNSYERVNMTVPASLVVDKIGSVQKKAPNDIPNYEPKNGEAGQLESGTEYFEIQGYNQNSYIAVLINGEYYLYKTRESELISFSKDDLASAPNSGPPAIMINDTLYYSTGTHISVDIDESEFIDRITSTVSISQMPTENGQANIPFENSPYAKYENGIILLMDNQWILFEERN